ncbi:hypothetical protein BDY21DRAFT_278196, partial [Lineolata rhizophorae]
RMLLAESYNALYYPDLAVGEAYKALLVLDEMLDEPGDDRRAWDCARRSIALRSGSAAAVNVEVQDDEVLVWVTEHWLDFVYTHLVEVLIDMGCLRSAGEFLHRWSAAKPDADLSPFEKRLRDVSQRRCGSADGPPSLKELPDRTMVRRELYPWNNHEPDRFAPKCLDFLNERMREVAPKLEVRAVELPLLQPDAPAKACKQLGVFAKQDIQPGETILVEKSLLTASSRMHDSFCDACSTRLPRAPTASSTPEEVTAFEACVPCDDCDDVVFCSAECRHQALRTYHDLLCGEDVDTIAKDAPPAEAADAMYSLLLLRALAMAGQQSEHPLDLPEVKYIWGDYHGVPLAEGPVYTHTPDEWDARKPEIDEEDASGGFPRTLPFSFHANVVLPLHMLEKIGFDPLDPIGEGLSDVWVVNTLYAKFRGTASARQGPDGRPEVAAVHPLWCLANHDCDPNVAWDWDGAVRFWARERRAQWKGRKRRRKPGLRAGDQVLSHYTDVELGVKDRREWAAGALGGTCMCERCVWESGLGSGLGSGLE